MGSFSIWHWLIVLFMLGFFGFPAARIIRRTGHSWLWVVFLFMPILNVIALWTLAFVRWPSTEVR